MQQQIQIDQTIISNEHPTYFIVEMSANHLQNFERAKRIIKAAKDLGANAIKLQSYRPDTITIDCHGEEFMCSKGSIWEGQNLFDLYKTAYMPWDWHEKLFQYAKEIGITIFSSPFDLTAIDLLKELDAPAYKIASYEIMDLPLIRKAALTGKPLIISTGLATLSDIELALQTCLDAGNDNVILLKCVSSYPTQYEELNLRTIPNMRDTFKCVVGLSDHSMGSAVDVAAVTLGARVIEKHMTLARADGGPDGQFSMEPHEFKQMIDDVRNVEKALGVSTYTLSAKQIESRKASRSLYVVEDLKKGEQITEQKVRSIRPAYGLEPKYYDQVLKMKASRDLPKGTALRWEDLSF